MRAAVGSTGDNIGEVRSGGVNRPSLPGQVVEHNGKLGVTTDYPRIKSDRIPVMFIGGSYPVVVETSELTVANSL